MEAHRREMNANHIVGHFFRVIFTNRLSPNAYLVLLYLYRRFASTKENPVYWGYDESEIDLRTLRTAHRELIHKGFIAEGLIGEYLLTAPDTGTPIIHPKKGQRFQGIGTFWFPWFVLDYRRLNASELLVYACLWAEKNHRVYLPDHEIASRTGLTERTVKRCLQSLRTQRMIACLTRERAWFTKIKRKSQGLVEALTMADPIRIKKLGLNPATRIRQTTLCDPERPGVECTPRTLLRQWIDFKELRDGDVLVVLKKLGVTVLHDNGCTIYCEIPNARTNEYRKVDPQTGYSLIPSDKRNGKGRRKHVQESLWELAIRYRGEDGPRIVRHWYDDLVRRNVEQIGNPVPGAQIETPHTFVSSASNDAMADIHT